MIELSARVQHRHDDFGRRPILGLVHVDRHAAAVVLDGDRVVVVDDDVDVIAVPGERLVDGVVDDFVHHVVQARAVVRIADIHAGPLAHGFQALEDLDFVGVVIVGSIAINDFRLAHFGGTKV